MTYLEEQEKQRYQELTDRVNALYEGFSPMEIRRCVINMCVSQFLDMRLSDIFDESHDGPLLTIESTEREAMDVSDIRWDHEHPGGMENAPNVKDYRVASDTGEAYVPAAFDDDSNA